MNRTLSLLMVICTYLLVAELPASAVGVISTEGISAPMLTPDYGIVTDEDRRKNERGPIPFLPAPEEGLFYWQCLRIDKMTTNCIGIDTAAPEMGCRKYTSLPHVEVLSEGSRYTFQGHKAWCLESCQQVRARLQHLLRGQKVACFGGEYLGENPLENPSDRRSSSWFLKRVKTRRGMWSYFVD